MGCRNVKIRINAAKSHDPFHPRGANSPQYSSHHLAAGLHSHGQNSEELQNCTHPGIGRPQSTGVADWILTNHILSPLFLSCFALFVFLSSLPGFRTPARGNWGDGSLFKDTKGLKGPTRNTH